MKQIFVYLMSAVLFLGLVAFDGRAASRKIGTGTQGPCQQTARLLRRGCLSEANDDFFVGSAACINIRKVRARKRCNRRVRRERSETLEECDETHEARRSACEALGPRRYDPNFSPQRFVDPAQIGLTVEPNPYFPLVTGYQWIYQGGDETVTDTVTNRTKLINGVTCKVVTDEVIKDGVVVELTDDWYAQDISGNVWYCGEISQDFEVFAGDNPQEPELVEIGGSWKAGVERAQPGIVMYRNPVVGRTYRLEVKFTDAEDMAEILSISGSEATPAAACSGNCVVTRDFTPLEPDAQEIKYYAPGVGLILEVGDDGDRTELIQFSENS